MDNWLGIIIAFIVSVMILVFGSFRFISNRRRKVNLNRLSRVAKIPLRAQAICVFTAAEMSAHLFGKRGREPRVCRH